MKRGKGEIWEKWQIDYLKKSYPDGLTSEISTAIGKSIPAIYHMARKLVLSKSQAFMESNKSGRLNSSDGKGRNCRFHKGHKPWNTGFKGLVVDERSKKTQFKKGQTPKNTLYDGARSKRKDKRGVYYWFVRVAAGKWEYEQIYRWKKERGEIPKGMILSSKDGDTLNSDPNNWELITKAENAKRNSGSISLADGYVASTLSKRNKELKKELQKHPELLEVARQSMLLNREIKNQKNKS